MFAILGVATLQLLWIQGIDAPSLSAQSASQRTTTIVDPATRGSITDRDGNPIAFTMEAKALTFQPQRVRVELEEAKAKDDTKPDPDDRIREVAAGVHGILGDLVSEKDLLDKMTGASSFEYLVRSIDPAVAATIAEQYPEVGLERQDIREYRVGRSPPTSSGRPAGTATACSASRTPSTRCWPVPTAPAPTTAAATAR